MTKNPQRAAWTVLIASLVACIALAVGVPTAVFAYINSSSYAPVVKVSLLAGMARKYEAGESEQRDARLIGPQWVTLAEGATIIVDSADSSSQASLTFAQTDQPGSELVTVQLYADTRLIIERAQLPRYRWSSAPDEIVLRLERGRVRTDIDRTASGKIKLTINTPQFTAVATDMGSFTAEADAAESRVVVLRGALDLAALVYPKEGKHFQAGDHAAVEASGLIQQLQSERDLIKNGDFKAGLEGSWEDRSTTSNGILTGTVSTIQTPDGPALDLNRTSQGAVLNWGKTGVEQQINANVIGRSGLQLRIDMRVLVQELSVCGSQGSECPLMLRIDYRTKDGDNSWTQGFYAVGVPSPDTNLPDKVLDFPQAKHVKWPMNEFRSWESGNLLKLIPDIQLIKSVSISAVGHSVRTQVRSVQLLVKD